MCKESSRLSYKSYQWQYAQGGGGNSSIAISPYHMKYMTVNIMYYIRKGNVILKMANII